MENIHYSAKEIDIPDTGVRFEVVLHDYCRPISHASSCQLLFKDLGKISSSQTTPKLENYD